MSARHRFGVALLLAWYALLLRLYPRRFREQFGEEMAAVFAGTLEDAARRGALPLLRVWLREMLAAPANLLRAHLRSGEPESAPASGRPGWRFLGGWALLCILAPAFAFLATFPLIAILNRLLGPAVVRYGHSSPTEDALFHLLFFPALGVLLGWAQALLLRRYLPGAWRWLLAVAAGWVAFALVAEGVTALAHLAGISTRPAVWEILLFLTLGLVSGGLQWLFFRRALAGAAWLAVANVLALSLVPLAAAIWQQLVGDNLLGQLPAVGLAAGFPAGLTAMLLLRAQGGSAGGETAAGEKVAGAGTEHKSEERGPRFRRTWPGLLLAALPHLAIAYLVAGRWRFVPSDLLLPGALLLLGMGYAWRRRWPRWSGSWLGYATVFAFVLLLELTQQILPRHLPGYRLALAPALGIWLPDAALWLLWLLAAFGGLLLLARRDPPAALLAIVPVAPVFLGSLEGTSTTLLLLAAALAAAIYLLRRLYPALLLLLAANLLLWLPASYRDLLRAPFAADLSPGEMLGMMLGSFGGLMLWLAPPLLLILWQALRRRDRWQQAP